MSSCHGTDRPAATGTALLLGSPPVTTALKTDETTVPSTVPATVLLVGNPNVGKSTLFNGMTGRRQRVMNAPGTTVELQLGTWRTPQGPIEVVDLPGTYSLVARSPDEQVVTDLLAGRTPAIPLDGFRLDHS